MNMPLFMPSHLSKYIFQQHHMVYDGVWSGAEGQAEGQPPVTLPACTAVTTAMKRPSSASALSGL